MKLLVRLVWFPLVLLNWISFFFLAESLAVFLSLAFSLSLSRTHALLLYFILSLFLY